MNLLDLHTFYIPMNESFASEIVQGIKQIYRNDEKVSENIIFLTS